jgi:tetratricopeptide (TPR) repeat protein
VDAINFYEHAIKIKPDAYEVINMKGIALQKIDNYIDALISHEKSIELKPDFCEAWYYKSYALYNVIRSYELNKAFTEAQMENKPTYLSEFNGRVKVLAKYDFIDNNKNKFEEVMIACEKSLKLNPNYVKALSLKGQILHDCGFYHDAIEIFKKILEIEPDHFETITNMERSKKKLI